MRLDWIQLDWTVYDWNGLYITGLDWTWHDWTRYDWTLLDWTWLGLCIVYFKRYDTYHDTHKSDNRYVSMIHFVWCAIVGICCRSFKCLNFVGISTQLSMTSHSKNEALNPAKLCHFQYVYQTFCGVIISLLKHDHFTGNLATNMIKHVSEMYT